PTHALRTPYGVVVLLLFAKGNSRSTQLRRDESSGYRVSSPHSAALLSSQTRATAPMTRASAEHTTPTIAGRRSASRRRREIVPRTTPPSAGIIPARQNTSPTRPTIPSTRDALASVLRLGGDGGEYVRYPGSVMRSSTCRSPDSPCAGDGGGPDRQRSGKYMPPIGADEPGI